MISRYLLTVKDKHDLNEISKLGSIIHVAKLANIITLETDEENFIKFLSIDNVVDIREANTAVLA